MKETIITSSVLILCVMLIRHFFKGKISRRLQYALWFLVAIRLIIPVPAQISLSLGAVNEFRVMDLAKRLEERFGDVTGRLEQPVSFAVGIDSLIGRQMAEYILEEDMPEFSTADGPAGIFLAGRTGLTWLDVLRWIWFVGMGAVAAWMITVNLRFRHKLHRERRLFSAPEKLQVRQIAELSGILSRECESPGARHHGKWHKHQIKVYTVENLASPCLYGFPGKEAVYLPEAIAENEMKLRHVLTHELCHKRHGDSLWSLLRSLLLSFYWFHPLVWVAAVLSKRDCELACDESVLLLLGEEERFDYGRTLLSIVTKKGKWSDFACTATTMTGTGKSIKERILYIAEKPRVLGAAVAAALILVTAVSVLIFTKSPQFSGGIWDGGTIYVMTGDKRIMLPDTICGISGYAEVEENNNDLIVYQVASKQEAGRFCTVTYEKALELVDSGRMVVPLGNYGQNNMLKRYMGIPDTDTMYIYTPAESMTGHEYTALGASAKAPFTFDGKSEWVDDGLNQSEKKPFAFDGQSEWEHETQAEEVTEGILIGVPGTDSNAETTYIIPDEAAGSEPIAEEGLDSEENTIVYLPDEQIIQVETSYDPYMRDCYIYVTAEYSGVKDKDLEEMQYIDSELRAAAGQVIVTGINREITPETFERLAEHKTSYLGDNSEVGALVTALPLPRRLSYQGMEMRTGSGDKALQVNYFLEEEEWESWKYVDHDVMSFNAVMLFATVENLDECIFHVENEAGTSLEEIVYHRADLTEQTGVAELWTDLEGEELQSWLQELHQYVVVFLAGKQQ